MAGHGGFLKFKTRPGRCDMVIINSPLKGLRSPPATSDSHFIPPSFSSGQRNRAYWTAQLQKSVTLQPQSGGGDREV